MKRLIESDAIDGRNAKSDAIDGRSTKTLFGLDIEKQKEINLPLEKVEVGGKIPDFWQNSVCLIKKREKKLVVPYIVKTKQQLKRRLPLQKSIINGCCLHPVSRTKKSSLDMVEPLAKAVPLIGL